ncbi:MAG: phosphoribosylamine--glycine ligase [Candidatus Levyibacteriota bacterium]
MQNSGGKTVVVIDSGGRGASLVYKYSLSPHVKKIIAIPGNDLMQANSKIPVLIFKKVKATDALKIVKLCKRYKADLVDIAQDNAVEEGITDKLTGQGFNVMGPTRKAGQIEWDKAWSRKFMEKYKIPSPKYWVFRSKKEAIKFIEKQNGGAWFIKASGLAEGKGAFPASSKKEAINAVFQMSKLGKAGKKFVIEQWIKGEEFSMFAISDGTSFQIVGSAQDHKRMYDADNGQNTGGMGCSTPALIITKQIYKQAEIIIDKTLKGLLKEDRRYKGVLYLGAIVKHKKVFVIEFNARWGDPEAEVIIPGMKNDLFEIGMHIAQENLANAKIKTDGLSRVAVTGVLHPCASSKKKQIFGIENVLKNKKTMIFGSRVSKKGSKYFVSKGRLFHIVGKGKNVISARKSAYKAMQQISIKRDNLHYRTDIGYRDVERLGKNSV